MADRIVDQQFGIDLNFQQKSVKESFQGLRGTNMYARIFAKFVIANSM